MDRLSAPKKIRELRRAASDLLRALRHFEGIGKHQLENKASYNRDYCRLLNAYERADETLKRTR